MQFITKPFRVLVIDDDEGDFFLIKDFLSELQDGSYNVEWASSYKEGERKMQEQRHDIYLVDHFLGAGTGLEMIKKAALAGCNTPKILLTGVGSRDLDIEAIGVGADDYLPKDKMDTEMLERTLRHSLERYEQRILIQQQQALYQDLFEQSNDPIYVTDAKWNFTEANNSCLRLFKYSEEELFKKNISGIFKHKSELDAFMEKNKTAGYVQNFTVELVTSTGDKLVSLISSSPIYNYQREITGYQGTIHDITQLKKAENEINMADKITMTGRMARMIAHEIRNPLTNINLAADQVVDEVSDSNDELYAYIEIIKRNSERINELISELLNSTRMAQLEFVEYPIETLLEDALVLCNDRINLKGINVTKKGLNGNTLLRIDPEKLKIAFVNIITNAIEAMDGIALPHLEIELFTNNTGTCVVQITDNGKGIEEKNIKHIFDAFFTIRKGGFGLGMTMVQHIILQHQGTISVESAVGRGSVFRIELSTETQHRASA